MLYATDEDHQKYVAVLAEDKISQAHENVIEEALREAGALEQITVTILDTDIPIEKLKKLNPQESRLQKWLEKN